MFLDEAERDFQYDHARAAEGIVAGFRESIGRDTDDPRFIELVGELSLASPLFRTIWARHDVRMFTGGKTIHEHPLVGELVLNREKLPADGLILVMYHADRGSESEEKLRMLASLGSPAVPESDRAR